MVATIDREGFPTYVRKLLGCNLYLSNQMNLDGMVLLVRSKVDACERTDATTSTSSSSSSADTSKKHAAAAAAAATKTCSAQEGGMALAKALEDVELSGMKSSGTGKGEVRRRRGGFSDHPQPTATHVYPLGRLENKLKMIHSPIRELIIIYTPRAYVRGKKHQQMPTFLRAISVT